MTEHDNTVAEPPGEEQVGAKAEETGEIVEGAQPDRETADAPQLSAQVGADAPQASAETVARVSADAQRVSAETVARLAMGAVGVGIGLWGLRLLLQAVTGGALVRLPLWLGGAVLADDFFLIPLTVGVGWLLTHWSIGPDRHRLVTTVRTTLLYVGITTLIAIPLLIRQGKGVNPTVLPRNYLLDWLLLEAIIIATGLVVLIVQRRRFTFRRSRASSGLIGGR